MEFFKSIFNFTKLQSKIFLSVSITSGILIFSNSEILKKLHLDKFDEYADYISLTFLILTVLVIINLTIWIFNKLHFQFRLKKLKTEYKQILTELDPKEKAVLREFVIQKQNSVTMPYDDPVVCGLIDKGILNYNRQLGNSFIVNGNKTSLSLSKYVSKILTIEHLDLKEVLTEEEKSIILEARPDWVNGRWY